MLTGPHQTPSPLPSAAEGRTIRLSFGLRPVFLPEKVASAPQAAMGFLLSRSCLPSNPSHDQVGAQVDHERDREEQDADDEERLVMIRADW